MNWSWFPQHQNLQGLIWNRGASPNLLPLHLAVSAPWNHTVEKYWRCTVIWPCLTLRDMCSAFGFSVSVQGWQQRTARRADLSQSYPKTNVLTFRKNLATWSTYRGWASCSRRKRHAVSGSLWWTQQNCKMSCSTDHESAWCSSSLLHL